MSTSNATAEPTTAVRERWETGATVTGDYARDCMEGDLPVPTEGWELTLDDVESLIDDEVAARGAAMCVCSAVMADVPLPEPVRFDVMSVCVNLDAGRVRVHHVRGVWQG